MHIGAAPVGEDEGGSVEAEENVGRRACLVIAAREAGSAAFVQHDQSHLPLGRLRRTTLAQYQGERLATNAL